MLVLNVYSFIYISSNKYISQEQNTTKKFQIKKHWETNEQLLLKRYVHTYYIYLRKPIRNAVSWILTITEINGTKFDLVGDGYGSVFKEFLSLGIVQLNNGNRTQEPRNWTTYSVLKECGRANLETLMKGNWHCG